MDHRLRKLVTEVGSMRMVYISAIVATNSPSVYLSSISDYSQLSFTSQRTWTTSCCPFYLPRTFPFHIPRSRTVARPLPYPIPSQDTRSKFTPSFSTLPICSTLSNQFSVWQWQLMRQAVLLGIRALSLVLPASKVVRQAQAQHLPLSSPLRLLGMGL